MVARAALILTDRRQDVRARAAAAAVATVAVVALGACAAQASGGETFVAGAAVPAAPTSGGREQTSSSATTETDDTRPATSARRSGTSTTDLVLEPLGALPTSRSASSSTTKKGSSSSTTVGPGNTVTMDEFYGELIEAGMSAPLAQCMVDELRRREFALKKHGELSEDEMKILTDVASNCALEDAGIEP